MDCICLHFFVRIKPKESFVCLLKGCHTMFLCAKSMIGINYIFRFSQRFSKKCHGTSSFVCKGLPLYSFAADCKLDAYRVLTTIYLATQTQRFSASKFFLEQSGFGFYCIKFSVFSTRRPEIEIAASICSELPEDCLLRNNSHSCLFSLRILYYIFF